MRASLLLVALGLALLQASATAALAAFLALCGLMLLHGLAQALAAVRLGFKAQRIAPQPLNAYAALGIPAAAPEGLLIALSGPVAVVAAGGLLWVLSRLLPPWLAGGVLHAVRAGLVWALLQALPALPLDGGYALCSVLSRRKPGVAAVSEVLAISGVVHALIGLFGLLGGRLSWLLLAVVLHVLKHTAGALLMARAGTAANAAVVGPPPYARRGRSRRVDLSRGD